MVRVYLECRGKREIDEVIAGEVVACVDLRYLLGLILRNRRGRGRGVSANLAAHRTVDREILWIFWGGAQSILVERVRVLRGAFRIFSGISVAV